MKVRILQPTRYDGKRFSAGDTPEVDRVAAKGLIDAGSAEPFDAKAAAKAEAAALAEAEAQAKAEAATAAELLKASGGQPPVDA